MSLSPPIGSDQFVCKLRHFHGMQGIPSTSVQLGAPIQPASSPVARNDRNGAEGVDQGLDVARVVVQMEGDPEIASPAAADDPVLFGEDTLDVPDVGHRVSQGYDVVARRGIEERSERRPRQRFDAVDQLACQGSSVRGDPLDPTVPKQTDRGEEPEGGRIRDGRQLEPPSVRGQSQGLRVEGEGLVAPLPPDQAWRRRDEVWRQCQ